MGVVSLVFFESSWKYCAFTARLKCWGKMGCDILVKVDSSVRELAEGSSLLELGGLLSVL